MGMVWVNLKPVPYQTHMILWARYVFRKIPYKSQIWEGYGNHSPIPIPFVLIPVPQTMEMVWDCHNEKNYGVLCESHMNPYQAHSFKNKVL